jgi:GMP reductase
MKALHYKDICLLPKYSELSTRKNANVSIGFIDKKFKLPIIPANMKCVLDEERAKWLGSHDYFYIMHRFDMDNFEFVKKANEENWKTISISVGVNEADKKQLNQIKKNNLNVDCITIDIAHGHSKLMEDMVLFVKSIFPKTHLIVGNICTYQAYADLSTLGVSAIKVGIGGGSACSTKNKTGFTYPMYSCVSSIYQFKKQSGLSTPIIADGGIREHADIVKAIHAGADMVMAGNLFSRLIDSPAELIDGHKVYFGSASQFNKGEYKNVEGIKCTLNLDTMTYADKLEEIKQDLQSAVSYAGGKSLYDIRKAEHIQVTHWEV